MNIKRYILREKELISIKKVKKWRRSNKSSNSLRNKLIFYPPQVTNINLINWIWLRNLLSINNKQENMKKINRMLNHYTHLENHLEKKYFIVKNQKKV